jgi:SAM-dependent methyltransferase
MMTSARYDPVAKFYEQFARDEYEDPPMAALLRLVGDVANLRLLDLACGHGRLTRELARRGAHIVGVDISAALLDLAHARETERPLRSRSCIRAFRVGNRNGRNRVGNRSADIMQKDGGVLPVLRTASDQRSVRIIECFRLM